MKMKILVAMNYTIQKVNHARCFPVKKNPGPTNVCSTKRTPKPQLKPKTGQNKEA